MSQTHFAHDIENEEDQKPPTMRKRQPMPATDLAQLKQELRKRYRSISDLTRQLQESLGESRVLGALAYRLPSLDKEEERLRLREGFVDRPVDIVATSSGTEAVQQALAAYGDWTAADGQATRFVARLGGALALEPPGGQRLLVVLERLNQEKRAFIAALGPLDSALERHEIVHELFPRLITQQLTRAIPFTTVPVFSVRFSWSRRMQSTVLSREQVDQFLLDARHYTRPVAEEGEGVTWFDYIDGKRQAILAQPAEDPSPYRLRRRLVARPIANVRPTRDSGLPPSQLEQHLPALILQPEDDFRIGSPRAYRPVPLRVQKYRDQGDYEPLIPALDLFRKRPR